MNFNNGSTGTWRLDAWKWRQGWKSSPEGSHREAASVLITKGRPCRSTALYTIDELPVPISSRSLYLELTISPTRRSVGRSTRSA